MAEEVEYEEYDEEGNLIEYEEQEYDEDGNPIEYEEQEYDEDGNPIEAEYDEDGNLIEYEEVDEDGNVIEYEEDDSAETGEAPASTEETAGAGDEEEDEEEEDEEDDDEEEEEEEEAEYVDEDGNPIPKEEAEQAGVEIEEQEYYEDEDGNPVDAEGNPIDDDAAEEFLEFDDHEEDEEVEERQEAAVAEAAATEESGSVQGMVGLPGPAWTQGSIEAPAGEKNMGTWTSAVYTEEQQSRLGMVSSSSSDDLKLFSAPRAQSQNLIQEKSVRRQQRPAIKDRDAAFQLLVDCQEVDGSWVDLKTVMEVAQFFFKDPSASPLVKQLLAGGQSTYLCTALAVLISSEADQKFKSMTFLMIAKGEAFLNRVGQATLVEQLSTALSLK